MIIMLRISGISHHPWVLYYRAVLLWVFQQLHTSIKCGSWEQLSTCYLKIKLLPRKPNDSSKTFLWLAFFESCGKERDEEVNPISLFYFISSYFWLCWVFVAVLSLHSCAQAFSSCSERGLHSCYGGWASHCSDFFCWEARALGHMGLIVVAPGL